MDEDALAAALDENEVQTPDMMRPAGHDVHRAAWEGDMNTLRTLLATAINPEKLSALDQQGNTALHVAAMRGHTQVVEALLGAGVPAAVRSASGWQPVHEAIQCRHKALAHLLAVAERSQLKARAKERRAALMEQLSKLPDFSMQLKWELSSSVPGLGMVVRRYAPHDTYTIWKQGAKLRVDGTLMGINDEGGLGGGLGGGGLLPEWERGHFSLIYTCVDGVARAHFINHTKKEWMDLKAIHKRMGPEQQATLQSKVDCMLASVAASHGVVDSHAVKNKDFRFDALKGWLGRPLVEDVDGWKAKVYEASMSLVKLKRFKLPSPLPPTASWEDYLAATLPPDMVLEVPTNPLTSAVYCQGRMEAKEAAYAFQEAARKEGQRITAAAAGNNPSPNGKSTEIATHKGTLETSTSAVSACGLQSTREGAAVEIESDAGAARLSDAGSNQEEAQQQPDGHNGRNGKTLHLSCSSASVNDANAPSHGTGASSSPSWRVPVGSSGMTISESSSKQGLEAGLPAVACQGCLEPHHAGSVNRGEATDGNVTSPMSNLTIRYSGERGPWGDSPHATEADSADSQASQYGSHTPLHADASMVQHTPAGNGTGGKRPSAEAGQLTGTRGIGSSGGAVSGAAQRRTSLQGTGSNPAAAGAGVEEKEEGAGDAPPHVPVFKPAKRLTGRCWMAEDFPLSLHQLLPLLEAIGDANKYVGKVAKFMSKYGDRDEFPVKVLVPLLFTLNMNLAFKRFKLLPSTPTSVLPGSRSTATQPANTTAASGAAGAPATAAAAGGSKPAPKKTFWSNLLSASPSAAAPAPAAVAEPAAAPGAAGPAKAGAATSETVGVGRRSRGLWGGASNVQQAPVSAAGSSKASAAAPAATVAGLPADFFDVPEGYTETEGEAATQRTFF